MNNKQNCWEFMNCGREAGGKNAEKLGVCPAAIFGEGNEANGGKYRGRVCWSIVGTFCQDSVKGTFAKDLRTCLQCDFYKKVMKEEDDKFEMLLPLSRF